MSTLEQTIRNTVQEFIKSYADATKEKKPHLVSRCCADDCKRHIGPPAFLAHVGAPPNLTMTNAQYEAEFGELSLYTITSFKVNNITVDAPNLKAAAWSTLYCDFIDGSKHDRTHAWFLDFNEDGTKIVELYQHNDVQEAVDFRNLIQSMKKARATQD
ncbi:uncharacterized protein E0L32_002340 [Thyridium curvatum]|uniref:Uncharacterized protein n=1 Tax=Thyridium curvatum TaxID=1093900 RepID=A0A507AL81_9PEZI|nr:uncharacterized protein E0L32_002340 [Thyridium curvatum]TPX06844.1 hypothetical protein E0L32_002340 [Thyridium curvatum]